MTNLDHIIPDLRSLAVPLDDLKLDAANARTGHALDRIAASLHRFRQRKPIVVNRSEGNKIEAGNGTWQAAKLLGWTHIAAVFVEDDPMTAVGYGIADNRLGDLSEWDAETLQALVDGLDPELNLPTGFDDDELAAMLAELGAGLSDGGGGEPGDAEPQTNRAEELRQEWGVKPGQLWRLPSRTPGQEHRLICGDCTDTAVVERVMGGDIAGLIVTDAPYSVGYNDRSKDGSRGMTPLERFKPGQRHNSEKVENDDISNYHEQWMPAMLKISKAPNWNGYLFCGIQSMFDWHQWLSDKNVKIHLPIIWVKDIPTPGFNFYRSRYEVCMLVGEGVVTMGTKSPLERWFNSEETQTTVWEVPAIQSAASVDDLGKSWFSGGSANLNIHPTQKPTKLIEIPIRNSSGIGEVVVDLFSGSGTTIIAAENLSRQCRALEISPAYVAVALRRYYDAFGITPELMTDETAGPHPAEATA